MLATHIAHLYTRDPLVVFEAKLEQEVSKSTDHFDNVQSTNWQSMRFKPPPPDSDIGWRVEFRPMELSLTDFENAAFSIFTILMSRVIIVFDLDLYVPLSRVDENMNTAHENDAARKGRFYFRRSVSDPRTIKQYKERLYTSAADAAKAAPDGLDLELVAKPSPPDSPSGFRKMDSRTRRLFSTAGAESAAEEGKNAPIDTTVLLMSADEIINGTDAEDEHGMADGGFPGLLVRCSSCCCYSCCCSC